MQSHIATSFREKWLAGCKAREVWSTFLARLSIAFEDSMSMVVVIGAVWHYCI